MSTAPEDTDWYLRDLRIRKSRKGARKGRFFNNDTGDTKVTQKSDTKGTGPDGSFRTFKK